jgi:hypothetical protein
VDSGFLAAKLLEKILPTHQFTTFGYTWSLNPGRFNMKEHMVITIMANASYYTAYANSVSAPGNCNTFGLLLTADAQAVIVQYLPRYLNQRWANNFGYQREFNPIFCWSPTPHPQ